MARTRVAEDDAAMNPTAIRDLVDYHYWAKERVLEAAAALTTPQFVQPLGSSFASVRDTLGHTLGAEMIWLQRWRGESPTGLPPTDRHGDLAQLRAAWSDQEKAMRAFLLAQDQSGLDRVIAYRAFNGQSAQFPLWQMVQHVVNHASYHRGQAVTLIRQLGAPGGKGQDLIAFYRERAAK